jgi:cellulose synthase/poly-beta-1,6-N-acetylglucosamine synthase-like glycosyltransferase
MIIAEILFVLSLLLVAYAYVGYPLVIFVISRLFPHPVRKADIQPRVSLIITAYNEERDIAAKLDNTLALDYPTDKLEIIVASDCSSDRTDEIVHGYTGRGVILHRRPERLGKSVAQNHAVKVATGELLVFSDATTMYAKDAVRQIVRSFADPQVGCVAGQLVYVDNAVTAVGKGCRSYWNYEKLIKESESRAGSLIGVSGCLYAVRRSSYARLALDMSSDFVIASEIHLQGLRTVYDRDAIAMEDTNKRSRDEVRMRVRVIEQTYSALHRYREALSLSRHGMFAFQLISHKVMRYAVPVFLILALAANLPLAGEAIFFRLTLMAQAAFYLAAAAGWLGERLGMRLGPLALPYYFALANAASLIAFIHFMRGRAHVLWEPIRDGRAATGKAAVAASQEPVAPQ